MSSDTATTAPYPCHCPNYPDGHYFESKSSRQRHRRELAKRAPTNNRSSPPNTDTDDMAYTWQSDGNDISAALINENGEQSWSEEDRTDSTSDDEVEEGIDLLAWIAEDEMSDKLWENPTEEVEYNTSGLSYICSIADSEANWLI